MRLRPVLVMALVAAAGFIPMTVNVGVHGELPHPLAAVLVAGIFTDTLPTPLVLSVLDAWLAPPGRQIGDCRVQK